MKTMHTGKIGGGFIVLAITSDLCIFAVLFFSVRLGGFTDYS